MTTARQLKTFLARVQNSRKGNKKEKKERKKETASIHFFRFRHSYRKLVKIS